MFRDCLNSSKSILLPSESTSIYADLISELSSLPSVTLSLTVKLPLLLYVTTGEGSLEFAGLTPAP